MKKNVSPSARRPFRIRVGIRQKVLLVLVTVLLAAMTAGSLVTLREEKSLVLAEINQRGSDISRFVAKAMSLSVVGYDYHSIQLLLDDITLSSDISYARVISAKGNTMGESGVLPVTGAVESNTAFFREPILFEKRPVGTLVLGLETKNTLEKLEARTMELLVRRSIVILLIAIAEFFALSRLIIRPLRAISDSLAKGMGSDGKLPEEIHVAANDELGHLASQFNSLHEQLNETNQALRSKIESADQKLIESNALLKLRSEELVRINEEFRKLSVTDPLTGLYNRRYFERAMKDELDLAVRHGDSHCILLIDIDYFKNINDTYGHLEGDRILQKFSMCLQEHARATDVLCRMGGEEFIVLCKRINRANAIRMAEKFRQKLEELCFRLGTDNLNITVSIGVAVFPKKPDETIDDIVSEADEALYFCKRNGRNQVALFDDIIDEDRPGETGVDAGNTNPPPNRTDGDN